MSKGQIRTIQAKYDQTAFSNTAQPDLSLRSVKVRLPCQGQAQAKVIGTLVEAVLVPFCSMGF